MNKKLLFSLVLAGAIALQGFATPAYASGPTGTVTYNGQAVQVTDGQFTLNGVAGTIDAQGNFSWNGNTGNILSTSGVTGYQITGQAPVAVTPTVSAAKSGMPTNAQILAFFATNPTNDQFRAYASQLGLNAEQTNTAFVIGRAYYPDPQRAGIYIHPFGDGKFITAAELHAFFDTNPTTDQIAQKASEMQMTTMEVANALSLVRGVKYDPKAVQDMINASPNYGVDSSNYIVPMSGPKRLDCAGYLITPNKPASNCSPVSFASTPPTQAGSNRTTNTPGTVSSISPSTATPGYDSNGNFIGLTAWLRAQNSSTSSSQPSTGNTAQVSDIDPLATSASSCANLTTSLRYGNKDTGTATDVTVLQDFLNSKGYLSIAPTGFFGRLTSNAVKAFQQANNITPSGFVGPITRAKIQSMDCSGTSATTAGANG